MCTCNFQPCRAPQTLERSEVVHLQLSAMARFPNPGTAERRFSLRALIENDRKGGFFHDDRFATLPAIAESAATLFAVVD